jgi:CubicO group peptidase (beta-lactamase class C family)
LKSLVVVTGFFLSGIAFAAPDELVLGKARGYPLCPRANDAKCLVAQWSRIDEIRPARMVAKGNTVRALKRAGPDLKLDEFLDRNRNTGLLVLKDDTILAERYQYDRKPEHRFAGASMAKTVVAMLVGIAVDEKKIASIDDKAQDYVPELKGTPYGQTSLRHLLTMSSGVKFHEAEAGVGDSTTLERRTVGRQSAGGVATVTPFKQRARKPGTKFQYASGDTQVLGLVLRAALEKPISQYLSEKIWQPMGAEAEATWLVDKAGYEAAFCCINATLRDWARFGMLLANYGALDGKQIIPAEWVKAATTTEAPHLQVGTATPYNGYGYQTWLTSRTEPQFAAFGVRGQAIFVDPAKKLVVVHTAVYDTAHERENRREQFQLWSRLLNAPSVTETAAEPPAPPRNTTSH